MKNTNFSRVSNKATKEHSSRERDLFPPREDKRRVIGFRIDEEKRKALKVKAAQEGRSVQEILSQAVDDYLMGGRCILYDTDMPPSDMNLDEHT